MRLKDGVGGSWGFWSGSGFGQEISLRLAGTGRVWCRDGDAGLGKGGMLATYPPRSITHAHAPSLLPSHVYHYPTNLSSSPLRQHRLMSLTNSSTNRALSNSAHNKFPRLPLHRARRVRRRRQVDHAGHGDRDGAGVCGDWALRCVEIVVFERF